MAGQRGRRCWAFSVGAIHESPLPGIQELADRKRWIPDIVRLYSGDAPPHAIILSAPTFFFVPRPGGASGRAPWAPVRAGKPRDPKGRTRRRRLQRLCRGKPGMRPVSGHGVVTKSRSRDVRPKRPSRWGTVIPGSAGIRYSRTRDDRFRITRLRMATPWQESGMTETRRIGW